MPYRFANDDFSGIVTYYALALNVESLAGDIFVNFILTGLIDVPAHLAIFVFADILGRSSSLINEKSLFNVIIFLGRRKCMFISLSILGSSSLFMAVVPKSSHVLVLIIYLVGKCSASMVSSVCWLWTAELYPTNMRTKAVGFCSFVAR